jgi:hypothetical protein
VAGRTLWSDSVPAEVARVRQTAKLDEEAALLMLVASLYGWADPRCASQLEAFLVEHPEVRRPEVPSMPVPESWLTLSTTITP